MRTKFALCLLLALSSCVVVNWSRDSWASPTPPATVAELEAGVTTLAQVLDRLGAPLQVWEHQREGLVLAYGWRQLGGQGVRVSAPVYRGTSVSFDYTQSEQGLRGVLLFFDADWRLEKVSEGWLSDLTQAMRRASPSIPDEEDAPPP